jgi:hypothetical protein
VTALVITNRSTVIPSTLSLSLSYTVPHPTLTYIQLIRLHLHSVSHYPSPIQPSNHQLEAKTRTHITTTTTTTTYNGWFIPYPPYPSNAITLLLLQPRPSRREQPPARPLHTPPIRTINLPATKHVLPEANISKLTYVVPSDSLRQPDDDSSRVAPANVPEASHPDPTSGFALPSPH